MHLFGVSVGDQLRPLTNSHPYLGQIGTVVKIESGGNTTQAKLDFDGDGVKDAQVILEYTWSYEIVTTSASKIMHLTGSLAGSIATIDEDLGGSYSLLGSGVIILKSDQGTTWEYLNNINFNFSSDNATSSHIIQFESPNGSGLGLIGYVNFDLTATSSEGSSEGTINLRLQQANPRFSYFTFPSYVQAGTQYFKVDQVDYQFSNWDADKTETSLNPFTAIVQSNWTLTVNITYSKYDSVGTFINNEIQSSSFTFNNSVGYSP